MGVEMPQLAGIVKTDIEQLTAVLHGSEGIMSIKEAAGNKTQFKDFVISRPGGHSTHGLLRSCLFQTNPPTHSEARQQAPRPAFIKLAARLTNFGLYVVHY